MEMPTKLKLKKVQTCSGCVCFDCGVPSYKVNPRLPSCTLGYRIITSGAVIEPAESRCPKPLNTNELAGVLAIMNMVNDNYHIEMKLEPAIPSIDDEKPNDDPESTLEKRVTICECAHQGVCMMFSDMIVLGEKISNIEWSCKDIGQTVEITIQCSHFDEP